MRPATAIPLIAAVAISLGVASYFAGREGWLLLQAAVAAVGWGLSLLLGYARWNPVGIQWFNRLLSKVRRTSVQAQLQVFFEPDRRPTTRGLLRAVQEWDGQDRRFSVISSVSGEDDGLDTLDLQTAKLGRLLFTYTPPLSDGRYADDESSVELTLPDHPYELGHLVRLLETPVTDLLHAVSGELLEPTGMNLDVTLDPRANPFYGVYIRDDVARTGVTSFSLRLEPVGTAARVEVDADAVVIRSQSRPEFIRVASSFLGFRS